MTMISINRQLIAVLLVSTMAMPVAIIGLSAASVSALAQSSGADSFLEKIRKKKAAKLAAQQKAADERKAAAIAEQPVIEPQIDDSTEPFDATTLAVAPKLPAVGLPLVVNEAPVVVESQPVVESGEVSTATELVTNKNLSPMLFADSAQIMRNAAELYRRVIAQGGFPKVGRSGLKRNSGGKAVVALNKRLFAEGYLRAEATQGEFAEIYTSATEDAVRRYQQNMGLTVTGKFDATTAAVMNVSAQTRLQTIIANISRLEAYTVDLSDRYVIVNVPALQIETVAGGKVYSRHNAIVGRPERPTPVAITALSDVNFNPYWNAPPSIIERDLFPKMVSGTRILDDMNIRVFQGFGGPEIDPSTVDWRNARADDYHFRQEPGEGNAMATAKINFPSPFGIYLHDTPEKHLFNSSSRFFSSGCVRVQNMSLLVNWVLNGQDGIGQAEISTLAETLERRDVKLATPPQLRVVYLTAWPTKSGTVAFRNDIYELDGSGFTVGQPMPVGETSPDGQRFVLKPLPRLVEEVDDSSGGGGGLFSFTSSKFKKKPLTDAAGKTSKSQVANKATSKKVDTKKKPGFDWATWRKEQAEKSRLAKLEADKKAKEKKLERVAKAKEKDKGKAKETSKKVASLAAKPVKSTGKKPAPKVAKDTDKKLDCKPLKDGKLPKGCKPAVEVKKKVIAPKVKLADKPPVTPVTKPAEDTAAN